MTPLVSFDPHQARNAQWGFIAKRMDHVEMRIVGRVVILPPLGERVVVRERTVGQIVPDTAFRV